MSENTANETAIDASSQRLLDWREIWTYRELFYFFTWRDIKVKYKQTFLGFAWAVLQPLLMMVIFTFFFGHALKVPSEGIPYPVFVFSGLLVWNVFSSGLSNAANSMLTNSAIIKKIYFPRLVIPVSMILSALFDFLMALIVFAGLLLFFRLTPSVHALWSWPASVIITLAATFGPGCFIASLNVKYRDFKYLIPFMIQVLFFLSPVLYPTSLLQDKSLQILFAASPMYAALELFRMPLTNAPPDVFMMMISLGSAVFWLIAGLVYFRKTENFFADLA